MTASRRAMTRSWSLHDMTEFSFQRQDPRQIGISYNVNSGRDKERRIRAHTVCGILNLAEVPRRKIRRKSA